jgi:SH3-like domain-containing protein
MALPIRGKSLGAVVSGCVSLAVLAGVAYGLWGSRWTPAVRRLRKHRPPVWPCPCARGSSGLPLPRFVTLKADRVNVRRGPSSDHQVSWVFTRRACRSRSSRSSSTGGASATAKAPRAGSITALLSGRRGVLVAPWSGARPVPLRTPCGRGKGPVALLSAGVMADVSSCTGAWCRISVAGHDGWIEQAMLWGVYPGERVGRYNSPLSSSCPRSGHPGMTECCSGLPGGPAIGGRPAGAFLSPPA